jgi:hypothetical protein
MILTRIFVLADRTFSYQRFVANGATGATVKHTRQLRFSNQFTAHENKDRQRKIATFYRLMMI